MSDLRREGAAMKLLEFLRTGRPFWLMFLLETQLVMWFVVMVVSQSPGVRILPAFWYAASTLSLLMLLAALGIRRFENRGRR